MAVVPWIIFLIIVFLLLALDLCVLNRKVHVIHTGEALKWTVFWIVLSFAFSALVYFGYENAWFGLGLHEGAHETGFEAWTTYITGYLIEKALSLDNIAVMAMIFASFKIPLKYQHRVLFWGILGALIFRGVMIGLGATIVAHFHRVLYIFGVLLAYVAIHSTFFGGEDVDPQDKKITKFLMKHFPYTGKVEGMHFFQRIDGKLFFTPLIVALIVIEVSDVIFAIDSIPAIFGITTDAFIVFTSNIFAILGLRSLYFVLASIIERFAMLKYAIFIILMFIAVKLLVPAGVELINYFAGASLTSPELPVWSSLVVVAVCIAGGIIGSLAYMKKHPVAADAAQESDPEESPEPEDENRGHAAV